jgi:uncharacterized protein
MRWLLAVFGSLFTVLAVLGAFLPVLPTTPFLLVAGACFARSSPRFHNKLKRMPIFGAYLDQWDRDHSIPVSAKRKAYALIVIAFSFSIWAVETTAMRVVLAAVGVTLLVLLTKLPTTDESA